jgi:3-hydroxyisobutyrate dehydrogenase
MLTDADALEAVVFGPGGVAETIRPGTTLIDMSTIGLAPIRSIAERLPDGVDVLDAPVRGSVDKARARTLGIVVGGPPDVYERWREVLAAMGTPTRVGDLGAGQAVKLVNNAAAIASIALVGEAVGLGERLGLGRAQVLDVLEETYIGPSAAYVRSRLEPGDFAPRFKAALAAKDVHLALDAGAGGPELRLVAATASWFDDAVALGLGGLDFTAIVAVALGDRPSAGDDA